MNENFIIRYEEHISKTQFKKNYLSKFQLPHNYM